MARVLLRQKAIDDLNDIWYYTYQKWSENQADRYYAAIKMACSGIGENPDLGKEYDTLGQNLLGLKTKKHIIFYQVLSDEEIEVIRILHEKMDLKNRLSE